MNPAGDTKKKAQRLTSIGSLFCCKPGAVAHFADIISKTSDENGDTETNAQKASGCIGSLFSRKPEAVAHFANVISEKSDVNGDTETNAQRASGCIGTLFSRKLGAVAHFDIIGETSYVNVPGPHRNTAFNPETPNTEPSPKQLTTEVETIQIDSEDETDTGPTTSRPQIYDPNNPYTYQCNLSKEKLDKLAEDDDDEMDDDSLKAFLNILRIESGKPVIMVSSHYRKRVLRLGLTKSLYDGDLKNFETAIIPIHMPNAEAAHWVLGIYRRNESILYFDSIGITYGMVKSNDGMTLELVTDWISETLKSAVRDITRDTQLDPKIEAVPLDGPQFDHHSPKYRINPQMDGVNCGFHIALIAESFLMNSGEVYLENFDIATERARILDILSGLRNDNYCYISRDVHNTPKDVDIDLEMQQSDNDMNASDKISDFCKNATIEQETVVKSVKHDHEKAPVPEMMNLLVENAEAFTLENDWPKASNNGQSPSLATNSDEALPNPDQEIEEKIKTLPMATDQQPIFCKGTEVPEMPDPEANGQPKTNVQRENLSRDDTVEDTNKKENEKPKSNNESLVENEYLRKKVQKMEETLAQFQEQMKQLQFEVRNKVTSRTIALKNGQHELEQNAPAIAETLTAAMPDHTDHPALTDCQPTLLPVINQKSAITEESLEKQEVAHVEVHVSDVTRAIMTTNRASDNGNIRLSQQNKVHTAVDPNASNNKPTSVTSVSAQTETPPLNSGNAPNKQIGYRASKSLIASQEHLADDKMRVSLKSRKQKHDLPVEIKRSRLSCTEQNLAQIQEDNSLGTSIVDGHNQQQNGFGESLGESATDGRESEYEFEQSPDESESNDDESEYRLERGTEKTFTNKARAHDNRKAKHSENNESKARSNSKLKVRPHLNKKRQISQLDVGPKCAVSGEKRVRRFKGRQKRYFAGEHKCKLCRYATNLKPNLARHMLAHTGEKPYQCQTCNYATTQLCNLKLHERIHSGERPYKCQFCEYATGHPSGLFYHKRTHSDEKPYKCQLCNFAATKNSDLIRHNRIHTGEKPYKCRFCQFASSRGSNLNQHMRTHHESTLKLNTADSKNNAKRNMIKNLGKKD